jgi:hypothetical protein
MSWQVPIYSNRPEEGTLQYLQDESTLKTAEGFFSFSYYNHDKIRGQSWKDKGTSIYIWGLYLYTKVLEIEPFQKWKLLIYTDQYTYEKLQALTSDDLDYERIQALLTNPKIVFVIVNWERHMRKEKKVNGGALRCFRSRAPFDFPDKLVLIRDADTFFDDIVSRLQFPARFGPRYLSYIKMVAQMLQDWETGYVQVIQHVEKEMGKPLLVVGTGSNVTLSLMGANVKVPLYKKNYHDNEISGIKLPFGVFAGMVGVLPGVPIYQTMDAWNECVDYINYRSTKGERVTENDNTFYRFSNNKTPQAMGRDEQMYLYILMKKSISNLFFFHIDLGDLETPTIEKIDLPFHEARLAEYKAAIGLAGGGRRQKTYRKKRSNRITRKH